MLHKRLHKKSELIVIATPLSLCAQSVLYIQPNRTMARKSYFGASMTFTLILLIQGMLSNYLKKM